jgi:hypothetical protein
MDPVTGELQAAFVPDSTKGGPGDKLHPNRDGYQIRADTFDLVEGPQGKLMSVPPGPFLRIDPLAQKKWVRSSFRVSHWHPKSLIPIYLVNLKNANIF